MSTHMDDTKPGIGDNVPPTDAELLRAKLEGEHSDLIARRDELVAAVERVPAVIEDDDMNGKAGDFVKQITAAAKSANGLRVSIKEPFLEGGRAVDGFFNNIIEPLKTAAADVTKRITLYQRKKAAEEAERRAEEDRRAREEADRLARVAAEKAAAVETERDLNKAVAAEQAAEEAKADAATAAKLAEAKPADMSRTRGEHGSVSSLRRTWQFRIDDYDKLPLNVLRPYIPREALEKAMRGFVKAGGREISGAEIFEGTQAIVR